MSIAMNEEIKEMGQKLKAKKIAEEEDQNNKVWVFVEFISMNEILRIFTVLHYKFIMCVSVSVCVSVWVYVRTRLYNHLYYLNKTFIGAQKGLT